MHTRLSVWIASRACRGWRSSATKIAKSSVTLLSAASVGNAAAKFKLMTRAIPHTDARSTLIHTTVHVYDCIIRLFRAFKLTLLLLDTECRPPPPPPLLLDALEMVSFS